MQRQLTMLVLDYFKSSVAQARYWAEVCLDPDDDCTAFRDQVRAILRDAMNILSQHGSFPHIIYTLLSTAYAATFDDIHLANQCLQQLTEMLQALEAQMSLEEVSADAASEAKTKAVAQ